MPTGRGLAGAVAIGAAVGITAGWVLWGRPPDRVATALRLLEERCAPHVLGGEPFDPTGFMEVVRAPGGQLWVEPRSRLAVDPSGRGCTVTDALAPLGAEERARFVTEAERLGLRLLPGAAVSSPEGGASWAVLRTVAVGAPATTDVLLTIARFAETDESWAGQTTATLQRLRDSGGG